MASTSKSRWAADDEETSEALALRKKEKEEKKRLKEDKLRRQREAAESATVAQRQQQNGEEEEEGPPAKRRRTSNAEPDGAKPATAGAGAETEGVHILSFPTLAFGTCRSVDLYEQLNNIEEGSYGFVSRARLKSSGEIVALKRLKVDHSVSNREGFPVTGLREIQTLKACNDHPHIVHLREVVVCDIRNGQTGGSGSSGSGSGSSSSNSNGLHVYLVLDFIEHDLKTLLSDNPNPFLASETKTLLHQTTTALNYLHSHFILHRDLKTSNLLLNNRGEIKLADFGMARYTRTNPPPANLTQLVVTLWYRAPELLLGVETYSFEIDIWSLGCVFAELLTSNPLFRGTNEVDQLSKIFGLLGPPTRDTWPDFQSLPNAKALHPLLPSSTAAATTSHQNTSSKPNNNNNNNNNDDNSTTNGNINRNGNRISPQKFPDLSLSGIDLLSSLLSMNPNLRPSASEVLKHPYFKEDPKPKPKEMFPTFPSRAGQEKRRRKIVTPDAPGRGDKVKELRPEDFVGVL